MFYGISPWQYSILTWNSFSMLNLVPSLPPGTFSAVASVGTWFGAGQVGFPSSTIWSPGATYAPGWANRFFAPWAASAQPAAPYPAALEDRAKDYVRKALAKDWIEEYKRPATAYDAYTPAQHGEMNKAEQAAGVEGRDKAVWELADSVKEWMENAGQRAEYHAALEEIARSRKSPEEKRAAQLANLMAPGSIEATEEVARSVAARMNPGQPPADKNPNAIMATYIQKMGGETVLQSLLDEVAAQVASRGVSQKSRAEYIADLQKRGFTDTDAAAVFDKLFNDKDDTDRRLMLRRMPELKVDKVDKKGRDEQYDQQARVVAMQAMDVKSEDELRALLKKYKTKKLAEFLTAMRRDVESKTISV